MNSGINLFRRRINNQLEKRKKTVKTIRIIASAIFIITVIVSLIFSFLTAGLSFSSLQAKETDLNSKLSKLNDKSIKILLTENRTGKISSILDKRSNFDKTLDTVTATLPSDSSVDNFVLQGKNITMTVKSQSLFSIDSMLNKLSDMVKQKNSITSISIEQLNVDPKLGMYSISLSLNLL